MFSAQGGPSKEEQKVTYTKVDSATVDPALRERHRKIRELTKQAYPDGKLPSKLLVLYSESNLDVVCQ